MNRIPGLSLRASDEEEELGGDRAEMGEVAYDYVEIMETRFLNDKKVSEVVGIATTVHRPIMMEKESKETSSKDSSMTLPHVHDMA